MKSNDVEKNKLVELLKKQHTGKLIFACKQRCALRVISELVGIIGYEPLTPEILDKHMSVVNELFSTVDINSQWLEIELEALEYFFKNQIIFDSISSKEQLIQDVNNAKDVINRALALLK
ncbi:hypothetical protein RG118_002366 [Providencia rettgeri]|nr:hypothetical protein [Providencia rettgeri]